MHNTCARTERSTCKTMHQHSNAFGQHSRQRVQSTALLTQQADEVDPQQAAQECVACAHDEAECSTQLVVALEDRLNAALFNHTSKDLVPAHQDKKAGAATGASQSVVRCKCTVWHLSR